MKSFTQLASCGAAALAFAALPLAPASAATVVGGSDLLTPAYAAQLETWLGQGAVTLTNVFDKVEGSTSYDFHAAADGQGATFSLIEVVGDASGMWDTPVLIGGYNPQSWSSCECWHLTPDEADRTAFVFNLTQGLKFAQRHDASTTNYGSIQTLDAAGYGPTFGGGHDLYVDTVLTSGYSALHGYGADEDFSRDIARYPGGFSEYWTIGQMEVFTISPVPEPETWALMLAGIALLGIAARRRRD